ncbi:MAG: hypothetical protein K5866_02780 [Treponema sp.]|nr:hypothetical protein [Treponema sp.]
MKKVFLLLFLTLVINSFIFSQNQKEEDFFLEYTKAQMASQDRIQLLHNKANIKKLGYEIVEGKVSGKLIYDAKIKGFGGYVVISWENYSDDGEWFFDGQIITTADITGQGKLQGQINVWGLYQGFVNYDNLELKNSMVANGTYGIQLYQGELVQVPYTLYFKAMQDSN